MKLHHEGSMKHWISGLTAITLSIAASAHGPETESRANCMSQPPMFDPAAPLPAGMPPTGVPHPAAGLELDEEQRDKAFALVHADAPTERETMKLADKTLEELRALAASDRFDIAKARVLADRHGQAITKLTLMRAMRDARVRELLTPGQRKQIDELGTPTVPQPGFECS